MATTPPVIDEDPISASENTYAPCILHDMLSVPSLAGRVCARLDAGKRMIYRFRHGIIGPLAIFWLIVTVASVITGAAAWSRFSRRVNASADPDQFRESINHLQQITWVAGLFGVGAGLFALASLPIIAVTASSEPSENTELRAQFSAFIRKPFSRYTLFVALAQFLQKASPQKGPQRQNLKEVFLSIPVAPPAQAAQWRELAPELRRQQATVWPALRASLAVNETRVFAHQLFLLGETAQCGPLATYAAALTTFADSYAIGQMEQHLAAFPSLVESIETSSVQPEPQSV